MQFKSPVFVVGYPRSGTTLLYYILMSSDEFPDYPYIETHYFSHYYKRYGNLHNSKNLKRFLDAFLCSECFTKTHIDSELFLNQLNKNTITYGSVFLTFMELFSSCNGKRRWLEKTPWHVQFIPQILEVVPDAKIVNIVRDGRDVALSYCNAPFMKKASLIKVAIAWKWHINHVEKYLKKFDDKIITIKYEELVISQNDIISKLNSFLNVDISINKLDSKKLGNLNSSYKDGKDGISNAPINRWKTKLSNDTLAQIQFIINENLKKYEYNVVNTESLNLVSRLRLSTYDYVYSIMKYIQLFIRKAKFVFVKD